MNPVDLRPRQIGLFLDVDGTLLDLAPRPEAVEVPSGLRASGTHGAEIRHSAGAPRTWLTEAHLPQETWRDLLRLLERFPGASGTSMRWPRSAGATRRARCLSIYSPTEMPSG